MCYCFSVDESITIILDFGGIPKTTLPNQWFSGISIATYGPYKTVEKADDSDVQEFVVNDLSMLMMA